ncbi:hypothetical protein BDP27DRAFT_1427566 [Rhodocollybia butyracea]|uniref:Uncharacterized protein n=1 Tax=Rhodocollybia butyracea TaxID=206335 RepID=A0A9P5PGK0_9AGAR|nr:hypothetical protein BDP27DRAFT_1427566 [Rhodocollybia butyracea]
MYSILLLFTFVACSILAVSSVPVPGPSDQAPAGLSPLADPEPTVTLFVTFIDGLTGQDTGTQKTEFEGQTSRILTTGLKSAFGLVKYKINYIGPCKEELPDSRRWLYIKVVGVDGCTTASPCFGWIARGDKINVYGEPQKPYVTPYVGISRGTPRRGSFTAFRGRPDAVRKTATTRGQQLVWNRILEEFEKHFMICRPSPPVPPSPPVIDGLTSCPHHLIVTFIDATTGTLKPTRTPSEETVFDMSATKGVLTRLMKNLFGIAPSEKCKVTYRGLYSPQHVPQSSIMASRLHPHLELDRQWVYFKVIGAGKCTVKSCFGFIAKGASYQSNLATKTTYNFLTTYVGISEDEPRRGRFVAFEVRPAARPDQPDATRVHQKEWNIILIEFQKHFMIYPSLEMIMTFLGHEPLGGNQVAPDYTFAAQINQALGISQQLIKYHGPYNPLQMHLSFTLIGGHPYCLVEDPCFGVVNQPSHGLPEAKDHSENKRLILIYQPKSLFKKPYHFVLLFVLPLSIPPSIPFLIMPSGHDDTTTATTVYGLITEWDKLLIEFERHFMIPHPGLPPPPPPPPVVKGPLVTFISGMTGEDLGTEESDFPAQSPLTTLFYKHFGRDKMKPKINYRGSYSPQHFPGSPMDRQWVYFKLTGVMEVPRFGWIAKGPQVHSKSGHESINDVVTYIGISFGEPRRGRFVAFKGRFDANPHQTKATRAQQMVWNKILVEFQKHFMIHRPPLPMAISLVDMNGGLLGGHQDVPTEIELVLTSQITLALDVSGLITYSGPYSMQPRCFFKLIGGHPYCQPEDPCFGVVEQPNSAGTHSNWKKERHILIYQPKVRFKGSKGFDIVGAYPLDPLEKGLPKMAHELHKNLGLH